MQYIVTIELDAFGRRVYVAPQLKMQAVDGMSRTLRQAIHEPLFFALCSAPNVHPHMGLLLFLNKAESTQVKSPESRAETKRQVYDIMLAMPRAPFSLNQLLSVGAAAGEGYWLVVVPQPTQDTAAAAGVGQLYSMLLPDHKQTAKAWQAEVCSKWAAAPQCGCTLMEYCRLQALRAQGVELTGRTVEEVLVRVASLLAWMDLLDLLGISRTLCAMHACGRLHCDMKPGNALVTSLTQRLVDSITSVSAGCSTQPVRPNPAERLRVQVIDFGNMQFREERCVITGCERGTRTYAPAQLATQIQRQVTEAKALYARDPLLEVKEFRLRSVSRTPAP
uniref:Protein kinase domain-containing protein n=1 Tax=Chlamydomonas leiostraca TaxID=1034604 RepID=A0A7S0R5T8_9CHLO|mmetsp:Transcript_14652/g.36491  ORF Transcript_14652/g.36491 Transcript_14652/m.36491 type:complete len:335 (+) Transcript_14652:1342-2346(+)